MLQVKGFSNEPNKCEKGDINTVEPQGPQQAAVRPQAGCEAPELTGCPLGQHRISESPNRDGTGTCDTPNSHTLMEAGEPPLTPFGSVFAMDYYIDEDLPTNIIVEAPDIGGSDEDSCGGWESPRLVIDIPDEEENSTKNEFLPKCKSSARGHRANKGGSPPERGDAYSQAAGSSNDQEDKEQDQELELEMEWRQALEWLHKSASKIRRPPNAFMIFSNEWRRKVALEHPTESNKEISVRLGAMWKILSQERKETYYAASRAADEEHKRKYPGYYYSPKEARLRKALKQDLNTFSPKDPKWMEALHLVKGLMAEANESSLLLVNEPR